MEMTYKEFINNILEIRGRFACGDEYHERHHILPKCMGGTNDEENLIDLFAREHFEAHRLLALENPENNKLVYAWWNMCQCRGSSKKRCNVSPEEYEKARISFIQSISGENNYFYGRHHSDEAKRKNSQWHKENMSGTNNPFYGKCHSEETKKKISEQNKGKTSPTKGMKMSKDFCKRNSESHKGQIAWNKGLSLSKEHKNKLKIAMQGNQNCKIMIVFCKNTYTIYTSVTEASKLTGININSIIACCRGRHKTAGNLIWKYLYDQTKKDGTIIPGAITLELITEEEALQQLEEQKNDNTIQN